MRRILEEYPDSLIGLLLYLGPGYEEKLERFYRRRGFERLSGGVMVGFRSPSTKR